PSRRQAAAERRRHRRRADGQHLPLRHLPTHPRGGAPRRRTGESVRRTPMKTPHLSRRAFLKTSAISAGGLVIAFVVPGAGRVALAQPAAPGARTLASGFL